MSKRKTVIELQSKPENKAVRRLFDKPKPVDYAPIGAQVSNTEVSADEIVNQEADTNSDSAQTPLNENVESQSAGKTELIPQSEKASKKSESPKSTESSTQKQSTVESRSRRTELGSDRQSAFSSKEESQAKNEKLRIFQTSTPITRTVTKFQKAAIVVRGENGKQLIELLWRDQMNEKTRDIWDFLVVKFEEAEGETDQREISIRKREILEKSGVKSDRTFISAIYTLEDMGLIEVKRLSGNKEGNIYVLTDEGREEIDGYQKQNPRI